MQRDPTQQTGINRRTFLERASLSAAALSVSRHSSTASAGATWEAALPDTQQMMAHISELYNCGVRRPGSPSDGRAERYILAEFERFGLVDVHMEPYAHRYWAPEEPTLRLLQGDEWEELPCFYIPTTTFTSREGLNAELVYVGRGENMADQDLKGKIVVFDQVFGRFPPGALEEIAIFTHKMGELNAVDTGPQPWYRINFAPVARAAAEQGAVGVIGLLSDMPYDTDRYYAPYDGHYRPFAGVWIRPTLCDKVRDHAKSAEKGTIRVPGTDTPSMTHNVVGVLPGQTDEVLIISCHHDAPFRSAVEDASGMSAVLALAEAFGALGTGKLRKTLLFLATAAHFGEKGALHFVKEHYHTLLPRVAASIHIEHIGIECAGVEGELTPTGRRQLRVVFTSTEEPRFASILEKAIIEEDLDRILVLPASNPLTGPVFPADGSSIYAAGIPTMNYVSGPVYLLNEEDTLDKVEQAQLVPVARTFARVVSELDTVPLADIKRPSPLLAPDFTVSRNPLEAVREEFVREQAQRRMESEKHQ